MYIFILNAKIWAAWCVGTECYHHSSAHSPRLAGGGPAGSKQPPGPCLAPCGLPPHPQPQGMLSPRQNGPHPPRPSTSLSPTTPSVPRARGRSGRSLRRTGGGGGGG